MGNRFEITVIATSLSEAEYFIDTAVREIMRIEALLTSFDENSQTNQINRFAGVRPVEVDREVFDLIVRSIKISKLTQGAFDISYGAIDKSLWNFDLNMKALPNAKIAKQAVALVDYRNILLDESSSTVMLLRSGMRIGFGGIGKGYAADRAKIVLTDLGVKSGVINASGDLYAWGAQLNGEKWTVGIANPNASNEIFSYLKVSDLAVATSGNYEKYVVIGGRRYSHTIDPRTGMPVHGIKSVTVLTAYAELADAMTTPIMVMGVNAGLDLINQMKDIEVIIIDDNNQMFKSKNINFN